MRINARNREKIIIDQWTSMSSCTCRAKVCKEAGGMKDLKNRLSKA